MLHTLLARYVMLVEGLDAPPDLQNDVPVRNRRLQEYAHVVTLFFEQRALSFIEQVLRATLNLEHYYAVFEFAKSRGQIHVHLLAWRSDGEPHHLMHKAAPREGDLQAAFASEPLFASRQSDEGLRRRLGGGDRAAAEAVWAEEVWGAVRDGGEPAAAAWEAARQLKQVKDEPAPSEATGGGEEAVLFWKGALLAAWMEQVDFSAEHPSGDDPALWPQPEGSAPPAPPSTSALRAFLVDVQCFETHEAATIDFCKLHRCSDYCLRRMRHPPRGVPRDARYCSKGGFGPEAPLLGHDVQMRSPGKPADGMAFEAKQLTYDRALGHGVGAYRIKLADSEAAILGADNQLLVVSMAELEHSPRCKAAGCRGPPVDGKPRRERAAIVIDTERGIDQIELPRDHPRLVQGIRVLTTWWLANDDQRVIMSRQAPSDCTAEDLAHVARYISSYLTKGNEGSEEYAAAFEQLLRTSPDDAPTKTVIRRLLIRTCGKDFPRQQVLYMLAGNGRTSGCLKHTDAEFTRLSLGARRLGRSGEHATRENAKDKYNRAVASGEVQGESLYEFLCTGPGGAERVPLISGGQTWASDPLTEQYAHNMLLLHYPGWSCEEDIAAGLEGETWLERFEAFRAAGQCPRFVEMEIARAAQKKPPPEFMTGDGAADDGEAEEQPAWMQLLGYAEYNDDQLTASFDDWTERGHDHSLPLAGAAAAATYPDLASAASWLEQQAAAAAAARAHDTRLLLPSEDPRAANAAQRLPIAILLHALYCHVEGVHTHLGVDAAPRRLLMLGKPGVGKSFVCKTMILLTRLVLGQRNAAVGGAPTGVAAFQAGLRTWHSLLKIPTGAAFEKSFHGVGAPTEVQAALARLFLLVGDELSMTGRKLFGWIGHRVATGVASGRGSAEPFGGKALPFALAAGDFHQLDPVFDSPVYKTAAGSANSNYGRQAYLLFEEVVLLDEVVRQKASQVQLRRMLDSMRAGAGDDGYDMGFVASRCLNALPAAERAPYEEPGHGSLWVYPTWDKVWVRNRAVLQRLNVSRPVCKCSARNEGPHAKKAAGVDFASLPPCVFLAVGLQVRLTVNLFGDDGISWGLVNGAIGRVLEVIYGAGAAPSPQTRPLVVLVRFPEYSGPAWSAADPKLVPVPMVTRPGDCCRSCRRTAAPLREAEGTTIHATQGLTIGSKRAVPRMAIDFGTKKTETNQRGLAYVAQSRPEEMGDFVYSTPPTLDRLTAVGKGKKMEPLRAELDAMAERAKATTDRYAALVTDANYEALLQWAEAQGRARGIVPPYALAQLARTCTVPAVHAAAAPAAPAAAPASSSVGTAGPSASATSEDPALQCVACPIGVGATSDDGAIEPAAKRPRVAPKA